MIPAGNIRLGFHCSYRKTGTTSGSHLRLNVLHPQNGQDVKWRAYIDGVLFGYGDTILLFSKSLLSRSTPITARRLTGMKRSFVYSRTIFFEVLMVPLQLLFMINVLLTVIDGCTTA